SSPVPGGTTGPGRSGTIVWPATWGPPPSRPTARGEGVVGGGGGPPRLRWPPGELRRERSRSAAAAAGAVRCPETLSPPDAVLAASVVGRLRIGRDREVAGVAQPGEGLGERGLHPVGVDVGDDDVPQRPVQLLPAGVPLGQPRPFGPGHPGGRPPPQRRPPEP